MAYTYDFTINLYQVDNSTLVGALDKDLFFEGTITVELNGDERFTVEVDQTHADFSSLAKSMVLQVVHTDANFTKRFRIHSIADVRKGEQTVAEIVALGLKFDLADERHDLQRPLVEQTVSTHLTQILSDTDFSVGTVTPSDTFTLDYGFDSVLNDLYRVREKVSESGTEYDIVVNDDMTVDLIIAGNQSSTSTIEYQKNLLTMKRVVSRPEANTFYVLGGSSSDGAQMTLRNARFLVTEVNDLGGSTEIVLDSDEILLDDDALNGFKVEVNDPEEATLISDSYKQGGGFDAVVVGGSPDGTFAVNDWVRFRKPEAVTLRPLNLSYIQEAASLAANGRIATMFRDENFQDVENLLRPYGQSACSGTYTAGVCQGWTAYGSDVTPTENSDTSYILNGTKSQKVVVGAFSQTPAAPTATEGSPAGVLNGSYTYKTCYVTVDGVGPISSASSAVAPANEVVEVGLNDSGYSGRSEIIGWQIYRKKSTDADYYKIGQLDDFTATFYDNVQDGIFQETHPGSDEGAGGQGVYVEFGANIGKVYTCVVNLFVSGPPYGQVRIELDIGNLSTDGSQQTVLATSAITADQQFVIAIGGVTAASGTGTLRVLSHNGAATFYVDSAMVIESPIAPPLDYFVAESAGAELWAAAYRYAQTRMTDRKEITATISDFYPVDDLDELQLGDLITLTDSELSVNESVRVTAKTFNLREAWKASISLSTNPPKIAGLLTELKLASEAAGKGASRSTSRTFAQIGSKPGGGQVWKVT